MSISLHEGDLPAGLELGRLVAVDTETMGLKPVRDRLCLVQLSAGDGHCHLVRFRGGRYDARNLERLLVASSGLVDLPQPVQQVAEIGVSGRQGRVEIDRLLVGLQGVRLGPRLLVETAPLEVPPVGAARRLRGDGLLRPRGRRRRSR